MKLCEVAQFVFGDRKHQLTTFMARTASEAAEDVSGVRFQLSQSFAKRLVGSMIQDFWFFRNIVVGAKEKQFEKKLRATITRPVTGAIQSMLVDHPGSISIDPTTFTEAFIQRLLHKRGELAQIFEMHN